jgi:hypothetical protein
MVAMMLFGNFAFGQLPICGNGNMVNNCPPTNPPAVGADANCQAVVPDFRGGVSGTAAPGYSFVGVGQDPFPGTTVTGAGIHPVLVFAIFFGPCLKFMFRGM